ncbi:MAG: hypothetical protein IPG24_11585 [Leptospiraceae bacterium]|nr:hypothetical protein [Leptospiraceae bacterium]
MKEYIEGIFQYNKPIVTWKDFKEVMQGRISINIPNKDSLLAKNLTTILNKIYVKTNGTMPRIQNSLLILLKENNENVQSSSSEFKLIPIIYSKDLEDNFILQNI